ncbi:MAG: HD-GYP domain-containing protein [Anaerolineae bacterium]
MDSQSFDDVRFERMILARELVIRNGECLRRSVVSSRNGHSRLAYKGIKDIETMLTKLQTETMAHVKQTAILARRIAWAMNLSEQAVDTISLGALLHDVGKSFIPTDILNTPGSLSDDDWVIVKQHPEIGYQMLREIPGLEEVARIVCHHHERYDGDGYPVGLAAEEIPLGARILSVADAFEAMRSQRPHSPTLTLDHAGAELRWHAGQQFDPVVVDVFLDQVFPQVVALDVQKNILGL